MKKSTVVTRVAVAGSMPSELATHRRSATARTALGFLMAFAVAASIHVIVRAQGGPGQNINVVTGSANEFIGDLFRQRQQEEVIAISSLNSSHMIVAYNDFRTIDFKDDTGVGTQSPVPGLLAKLIDFFRRPWQRDREGVWRADKPAQTNAAWMGFSITDNGGKSWYSGLHPGRYVPIPPPSNPPFPGDESFKLHNFDSASDPVVGATHNEFFFAGIAFNPPPPLGDGKSIGFWSRFTDYNDTETGQNIRFDGTRVLLKSDDFVTPTAQKIFVDKPSIVAVPGAPGGKAYVYAAFVVFDTTDPQKLSSKILFFRSHDSGETFSGPVTVSQPLSRNQSPWIVPDPNNPTTVYIGWRVFANPLYPTLTNAIVGRKSVNGGESFTPAVPYPVALLLKPFDQPQGNMSGPNPTLPSPRSAAYPTATIDGNGAIHMMVQEYVYPSNYSNVLLRGLPLVPSALPSIGVPRVTSTTSYNGGATWTVRRAIDLGNGAGTQFMPMVTSVGEPGNTCPGKPGPRSRVIVMYYDARASGVGVSAGGTGIVAGGDKQFDVRVAQATACSSNGLSFLPSEQVSQYTRSSQPPFDIVKIKDSPYAAVNRGYTMNCAGNCSFAGDYIHQSPRNPYVKTMSGAWKSTTAIMDPADRAKLPAPVVQLVWADTRDGLLPTTGSLRTLPLGLSQIDALPWQEYAAPGTGFASCINPGSRDQNVYTAEYTPGGLYASAPVTFKTATIPRSYPLYIENRTGQARFYRVTINDSANASFDYSDFDSASPNFGDPLARTTTIVIAAVSSVTGTVVVGPNVATPISITVAETNSNGDLIAGATTTVTLNTGGADASSTETYQPVINPFVTETKPFLHLGVNRANGQSLVVPSGTAFPNPTPLAPNPLAPNPLAPNPLAPNPLAPNPLAPNPLAPNPLAPNPLAPNPLAPNPFPGDVTVYDVTDLSYVVTNEGDQTAALKVLANATTAAGEGAKHVYLMLINRAVPTPAFSYDADGNCKAVDNWQAVPLSTFVTPLAPNPLAPNPLAPNPLAPNPLAPNPLAPNYPPDVSNATFYVAPTSPEQTTAQLTRPRRESEQLARRAGDARIRRASLEMQASTDPYVASRPRDVTVVTIRDIVIDPTGTALTKTNVNFKVKSQIPNHDGENFAGEATETGTQIPNRLAFAMQPTNTASGGTITPAVQVAIQDTFGNTVTNSTRPVTIAIQNNPAGGTLSGTLTKNAVAGMATFDNLSINNAGAGYTLLAASASLTSTTSSAFDVVAPSFQCFPDLPNPVLTFTGTEEYQVDGNAFTRYKLSVSNRASFPDALFTPAPDLPPCGLNTNASRTWVNILRPNDSFIYGFCALSASSQLDQIWFAVPAGTPPPSPVHITLEDRRCEEVYTSNAVTLPIPTRVLNTDFVSVGYGGMRGGRAGVPVDSPGTGTLIVSGVSGPVTAAFLYWHGPTQTSDLSANSQVTFAGQPIVGTNIGLASDNNWGFANSHSYAANVTSLVTGNGPYSLNNFRKAPDGVLADINGVSLIVFFDDGNAANNRDVYLVGKNDSNVTLGPSYAADDWNDTLTGINYGGGTAVLQLHVSDGQGFYDGAILLNQVTTVPAGVIFQGTTVQNEPASVTPGSGNGGLWDIRDWNIPEGVLFRGPNNSVTMTSGLGDQEPFDYLSLVVMLISVPHVPQ